jgi:tetratricopeptide (TPR) repeat protein
MRFPSRRAPLIALALLMAPVPVSAAERSVILLYGFTSSTPATPQPVPPMVALLLRDELQKNGKYAVLIRDADDPLIARAESEQPTRDPTRIDHALQVARQLGARYVVQGVITAYQAPQATAPGQVTFRLTAASAATDVSRDVFVTAGMKVSGKGAVPAAKILAAAVRAVGTAITAEAIPSLEHATPADRAQAAERSRTRGQDAAASGATPQAVADLRRAARLTPEDAATHAALGEALIKQGMVATALLEFRQALALAEGAGSGEPTPPAPGSPPALDPKTLRLRLVRALGERGLWDEAIAEARRGLERDPDSEPLRLAMAEAAIRAGDGAAALAALKQLHAARPPRDAEWNLLADADALVGDAPRWLDALVRGAVAGVPEAGQYAAVIRRLDQVFHALADEAEEAERWMLAGRMSPTDFGTTSRRRAAQAKVVAEYLGRLAYPDDGAAAHEARQEAWSGLLRAGERAVQFASAGSYDDLAAARSERLRALARLEPSRPR